MYYKYRKVMRTCIHGVAQKVNCNYFCPYFHKIMKILIIFDFFSLAHSVENL